MSAAILKSSLILAVLFCLIQLWVAQTLNYCSTTLCDAGQHHIACNNAGAFAAACSADARIIVLNTTVIQAILKKHNILRNQVALGKLTGFQPAIRMATMVWDNELAKLAVLNVKQCAMKHDECHGTTACLHSGQNLAYTGWAGSIKTVQSVAVDHVQMWFDEYKAATMVDINSLQLNSNFFKIGHFTALVQEKNNRVGCAVLRETVSGFIYQYMACNYAYTNVITLPVYRKGITASKCVTGKNPNYLGLCKATEVYKVNVLSY